MHVFIMVCAVVTFGGSGYLGCLAFELCQQDMESHVARWPQVGADFLILATAVCGLITSLYAFAGAIW